MQKIEGRKILRLFLAVAFALATMLPMAACESNNGPAEEIGEEIDNAVDNTKNAVENAGDEIEDAVDGNGSE